MPLGELVRQRDRIPSIRLWGVIEVCAVVHWTRLRENAARRIARRQRFEMRVDGDFDIAVDEAAPDVRRLLQRDETLFAERCAAIAADCSRRSRVIQSNAGIIRIPDGDLRAGKRARGDQDEGATEKGAPHLTSGLLLFVFRAKNAFAASSLSTHAVSRVPSSERRAISTSACGASTISIARGDGVADRARASERARISAAPGIR